MQQPTSQSTQQIVETFQETREALCDRLVGLDSLVERMLIASIAGGHLLIEGAPGLAKTRAVKCYANSVSASFARIQATPDLLPADLTGTNIYQQQQGQFEFMPGPLFNNIILVDEINRAPPKVQSALLEAMGEKQITSAGETRTLQEPFMVIATQNPIEHEGTYPLPEAQLDRFMFFVNVELPDVETEKLILKLVLSEHASKDDLNDLQALVQTTILNEARQAARTIHISDAVVDYITRLVCATRSNDIATDTASQLKASHQIQHAASPRGSIYLAQAAQVHALLQGRDHVTPEDVSDLAADVLSGRIILTYEAQAQGIDGRAVIKQLIDQTAVV